MGWFFDIFWLVGELWICWGQKYSVCDLVEIKGRVLDIFYKTTAVKSTLLEGKKQLT